MLAAVGVGPRNAAFYTDAVEESLRSAAALKHVRAIGSCGISEPADEAQVHAFRRQAALAAELGMPLVVEAHGAYEAALEMLAEWGRPVAGVLLRAFDGDSDDLRAWTGAGAFVSFDSRIADDPGTWNGLAALVPQDRILVESGAPGTRLEMLAGFPPRCDQMTFAAEAIAPLLPPDQLARNFSALYDEKCPING